MPDATKDRPVDMAPSLIHSESGQDTHHSTGAGARTDPGTESGVAPGGTPWHLLDAMTSSSSSSFKRMSHANNNNNLQYPTRQEPAPLSIALPLNSRTNGSHNAPSGSLSAGYLDQRRDTFHSLSHPPPTHSINGHHNNSNGYSNNSSVSWQTYSSANIHDDHHHHPQPIRPQSISYASHQHPLHMHHHQPSHASPITSSMMDQDTAAIMRRRRLSSASASSKRGGAGGLGSAGSSSNNLRSKAPNTPHHTRRFTTLISDQEPDTTYLWGYLLFFSTMVGFTVCMYALVASNYMPLTGNKTLDWIKKDSHYCMLVPVTIPVTVLFVLFNWLGMKLFRHN